MPAILTETGDKILKEDGGAILVEAGTTTSTSTEAKPKTRLTVRKFVRSYLDEASEADWSDEEINIAINTYYHNVRTVAIAAYEDYYMQTNTFNSVANQEEYGELDGVPLDIFKMRRVELNYDVSQTNGAPTRCMPIHNIDAVRRDLAYANAGIGLKVFSNAFYYSYGFGPNFKIGFSPVPNNNGVNAIKIWYIREAPDIDDDDTIFDIPYVDKNWILIAYGAVAELLRFGSQDPEDADRFDQRYQIGVTKMQEELEDREAEDAKSVLDTTGNMLDFDNPMI